MASANDQSTGIVGGRPWPRPAPNWRPPSPKYLMHLAFAFVGITTLTTALGGEIRMRASADVTNALSHEGLWMFIFCGLCGYWFRLIFWGRVPPRYQDMVRTTLTVFVTTGPLLAAVAVFLVATQGNVQSSDTWADTFFIRCFTAYGALCQISSVIWLLRYRKE